MQYVIACSNEYVDTGIIHVFWIYAENVVEFVRRYFEFPEDIDTVDELVEYFENDGSFEELDGETHITITSPRQGEEIFVL